MKKSIRNLVEKSGTGTSGLLRGGFGNIKGGMSAMEPATNATCTNATNCANTNLIVCFNSGICSGATNVYSLYCVNTGICTAS